MVQGFNHIQRLLAKYPSDDVRYVPTTDEQIERLKNVSLDQVRTLYNDYLGAEHGEVVVIGDFDASAIVPVLSKTFDGWKSEKPYAWIARSYQPELEPKRETVATPDKENAIYIAGQIMPIRDDDPDYPCWPWAISCWAAVLFPLESPIAFASKGDSHIPRCRCCKQAPSIVAPTSWSWRSITPTTWPKSPPASMKNWPACSRTV